MSTSGIATTEEFDPFERYQSLEEVVKDWGGVEVTPMEVCSDIFDLGYGFIQRKDEAPGEHKANPIILGEKGGRITRRIMFEDTFEETLAEFQDYDWAIMSGLTFWGRENTSANQSKMCALIFDLDGTDEEHFNNLLRSATIADDIYPMPNYVALSGHNVHLYYVFEEPLSLYPHTKTLMKELKYALTRRLWNRYTSTIFQPQFQGINQGFRILGGRTKVDGLRVKAFRLNAHPTNVTDLNRFVPESEQTDLSKLYEESRYTLEDARRMFPEWYERRIVNGGGKGHWVVKEDLYNWWLRKIREGATFGHRYFCVMCLAIFAAKCGIHDKNRVYQDAVSLIPGFNKLNDQPFTEDDIASALECLDERYITFPRKDMERISAIEMPTNKRNGRKQEVHLAGARAIQKINDEFNGTNWREGNGRPKGSGTKRDLVCRYIDEHPDANHSQIAKELGISRTTVIRWAGDHQEWKEEQRRKNRKIPMIKLL